VNLSLPGASGGQRSFGSQEKQASGTAQHADISLRVVNGHLRKAGLLQ
jgi:hypothetical protein